MIEFICFLIFVGIIVFFWGIGEENEQNTLEKPKEQKPQPLPTKDSITFEIESPPTSKGGDKKQSQENKTTESLNNNVPIVPQGNYLDELLTSDLDIKNNLFAQKLRLKQGGNVTEKNRSAGVYAILCEINNRVYIGSSVNLYARMKQHLGELRQKNHHSYRLQEDFDKFGENNFTFWVLEEE